ncbi:hypothetical protein ACIBSV_40455 [Embleya sp. NPDC050154]|uniref:hypothetical protein n=1 Tax=Embleya sp. NPDC050154 TaxID=3363988 RepID=UPI00379B9C07
MTEPIVRAADPLCEDAERGPADGVVREKRIALWGARRSGRSTFLAMVEDAAAETRRRVEEGADAGHHVPGWNVFGADGATLAFVEKSRAALRAGTLLPESITSSDPGVSSHPERCRFLFRRRPRTPLLRRFADRTRFVATVHDLPNLAETRAHAVQPTLNECTGLILLFDPIGEAGHGLADLKQLLREASAVQQPRMRSVDLLPLELAVCVTKIDDMRLFRAARWGAWTELDRHGRIRIRDPKAFFHWLCDPAGPFGASAANKLPPLLDRHFDRIRYYATSSVGFFSPDGVPIDPESCRNVTSDRTRLEGRPRPQGIVEPILGMRATRMAKEG